MAEPVLLKWLRNYQSNPTHNPIDEEYSNMLLKTWDETRAEGRTEGRAEALLTVLQARGLAVSDPARERILSQKDLQQLERWLRQALVASTIDDVFVGSM